MKSDIFVVDNGGRMFVDLANQDGTGLMEATSYSAGALGTTENWNTSTQLSPGVYGTFQGRGVVAVGKDAKLYVDGLNVSASGAIWKPGVVYHQSSEYTYRPGNEHVFITDSNGQLFSLDIQANQTIAKPVKTSANLLPNETYSTSFTDQDGKLYYLDHSDVNVNPPDGLKLLPNQTNFNSSVTDGKLSYFVADTSGQLVRVSDANTPSSRVTKLSVRGLTPGSSYGVYNAFAVADTQGQLYWCSISSGNDCVKVESTNIGLPPGTVINDQAGAMLHKSAGKRIYATGGDGNLYSWELQVNGNVITGADWKPVPRRIGPLTPGQTRVSSASGDPNRVGTYFAALDKNGSLWTISEFNKVRAVMSSVIGNTVNQTDCTVGQLPQSGDPAASWLQLAPYVAAVLAVGAAGVTLVLARRRASV